MRRAFGLILVTVALIACGDAGRGGATVPTSGPSVVASPAGSASSSTDLVGDFEVDGREMHLVCVGPTDTGEPTILIEAGGGLDYTSWGEILPAMQATHRVCAYDRAGLGLSEPPTEASRTAADQASDLHDLLEAAGVTGPFVIGAHSFGAIIATLFTQAYPDDVVGVVFVDPQAPRQSAAFRKALPPATAGESSAVKDIRDVLESFETDPSQNPEHVAVRESGARASAALDLPGPFFGDRPVIVLSAGRLPPDWSQMPPEVARALTAARAAAQQELADESTAGSLETVPDAGHNIQVENPPVVIKALEKVLAAVRGATSASNDAVRAMTFSPRNFYHIERPFGSKQWKPRGQATIRAWTHCQPTVDDTPMNVDEPRSCVETRKPPHLALAEVARPQYLVFRA